MITARVAVEYGGHWTAKLGDFDVYGKFLAYKFSENRSFALLVLVSPEIDMALDMLSEQTTIEEMEVLNRTSLPWTLKESSLLLISSKYREIPPMELLTYEGFNPLGNPLLEDGRMYFDLFLTNKEALAHAVALLENYGEVSVEYLSKKFKYQSTPKTSEFEQLLNDFGPNQLETLSVAVQKGYFDDKRDTTVSEIATEIGTDPSTVSRRLRKARLKTLQFVVNYLPQNDTNTE